MINITLHLHCRPPKENVLCDALPPVGILLRSNNDGLEEVYRVEIIVLQDGKWHVYAIRYADVLCQHYVNCWDHWGDPPLAPEPKEEPKLF
jgi:hypothetical protein